MKKSTVLFTLIFSLCSVIMLSCKNETECFDKELYEKHKNDICPMDCPGVVGCDDKTYCNECIARTKGIRVK